MSGFAGAEFRQFVGTTGVATRRRALPLSRYPELSVFTETNDVYLDVALELGERALLVALNTDRIESG